MRRRILVAASVALLAWFVGKALNVPVWRDWDIGERTDFAVVAFFAAYLACKAPESNS